MLPNFSVLLLVAAVAAVADAAGIPVDVNIKIKGRALTFPYGVTKVQGVNLGGWFVLEPWITPSIFENAGSPIDEYSFCRSLGPAECKSRLTNHWSTFITADDFAQISAAGLNHVRIPIGYWAVQPLWNDPYVQGQLDYLTTALGWARQYGLKVWIDLHGAPGSQNGFDNSGSRDRVEWQQGDNVKHTVNVIRTLSQRFATGAWNDVVTAIELLNEPLGPALDIGKIRQYWFDGWGTVRDTSDIAVVIGDAFLAPTSWNGFMSSGFNNVILDAHHYQVFDVGQLQQSAAQHVQGACGFGRSLNGVDKWTVIGEWSAARTDCTKYLNGIGRGTRWEGSMPGSSRLGSCGNRVSGSVASYSEEEKQNTRRFVEAQMDAYERVAGWFFWTWKSEGSPDWELRDLIRNGLFPKSSGDRRYPNQCGF